MNDNVKLWNDEQYHARTVELVCQILQSNDKQVVNLATAEFYTLNSRIIYNFILKKLGNAGNGCDAEELTNDTFQRTFTHLHTIKEPEKILNWMFKVADQLTAGWYRKNRKVVQLQSFADVSEYDIGDAFIRAHQEAQDREMDEIRREKFRQAIDELPELERQMFYMLLENKSYEEIFAELREVYPSLKSSSVRNRLSRVKKNLKTWVIAWEKADAEGYDLKFSEFMENQKKKK